MRWQIGICGDEHMGIKLGNICRFQSGGTPAKGRPEFFNGTIPWITTTALNGGNIGKESAVDWICEQAIKESAAKIVPAFSIMVGTRVGVGKVAINTISMSTSQDIVSLLDIDESIWSKAFLCKFLQAKGAFRNAQARGATIKGIKIDVLSELELPEIPIEEQQHISQIIDKVKTTIAMRQSQLQKLDELVKARFVEMFGEPLINTKGWGTRPIVEVAPIKPLHGNLSDKVWLLNLDAIESQTGNVLFKQRVRSAEINASTVYFTTENILYSKLRPYLNKVVMPDEDGIATSELIPMCPQADKLDRTYLCYWLRSDAFVKHISEKVAGAKMPRVSMDYFRTMSIELPPIKLQEQFASFVEQADRSKAVVQKSLDKAQLLFDSLMQEYFG